MDIRSNELVTKELQDQGLITDETFEMIEQYKFVVDWMSTFKFKLKETFSKFGIKKWETDIYDFTYVPDGLSSYIDKDLMKQQSVWVVNSETGELEEMNAFDYYERFKMPTQRAGYIKIKEKYER